MAAHFGPRIDRAMKVLFIARHFTYFRNYDSALVDLAARGHAIHLAVEKHEELGGRQAVEALARAWPSITFGELPERADDSRSDLVRRIRYGLDYLRYLDPFYDHARLLRQRALERTPQALIALADPPVIGGAAWRRWFGRWLHRFDLAVPPADHVLEYLRQQHPDVVLITPLVDLGSQQIDFLRAARLLGIPAGLAVWSWDHLSSKAYIREFPERVFVWNDKQRSEAVSLHRVPADRVVVTGAQCFDRWFTRQPSRSRQQFCAELGLPPDRPLVLFVCSALIQGSPPEPPFVREWLTHLRGSGDPVLANAAVLVRPHPSQTAAWRGVDLSDLGPVAVRGGNPIDESSRSDYFDALYHSAAVVGLNTSAFIEAGIVGREVLAILPPQFHDNQEGTVHFRYLLEMGGGLLRVSRDFNAHVEQLSAALARPVSDAHPHRAFLESFVRPRGLASPATPVFVEAVEQLATCRVSSADVARQKGARWRRVLLDRAAAWGATPSAERWLLSPRESESLMRLRAAGAAKAEAKAERRRVWLDVRAQRAAERARRDEELARRRSERQQEKERYAAERRARRAAARAEERSAKKVGNVG
jgi:hypothetical protein